MSDLKTLKSSSKLSIFFLLFSHRRYDEDAKAAWSCGSWCEYIFVVVLSSILLLASIILTVVWLIYYRGTCHMSNEFTSRKQICQNTWIYNNEFCLHKSKLMIFSCAFVPSPTFMALYIGGYSLEDKNKLFNFHPTLMIAGYITFSGFCKRHSHSIYLTFFESYPVSMSNDVKSVN